MISAASSSVGLAAIEIVKAEGGISIATTHKSSKDLTKLGADHVIATDEEDYVAKVAEITGGKGARVTFDPVGGPFLEKLAEAAQPGGIIFSYGWLSGQPTPLPLIAVLAKGSRKSWLLRRSMFMTDWPTGVFIRRSRRPFRLHRQSMRTDTSNRMHKLARKRFGKRKRLANTGQPTSKLSRCDCDPAAEGEGQFTILRIVHWHSPLDRAMYW